ncbi:MAG: ABC transporter permease subunit [Gemmatimonadaceae bacterium]
MRGEAVATRLRSTVALRAALIVMLALTSVGPLLLLVVRSLSASWFFPTIWPTSWTSNAWRLATNSNALLHALGTSVILAVLTAVLSCAAAMPLGRAVARLRRWPRHIAAAAAFLPVAAPPLALATGLQVLLLALGLGGSFSGVLLAHLVPAIGYLTLLFLGTFTLFDMRVEEESRTLGATATQTWWRVTLPLLRPQITEAMVVGFLVSWSQFALTLVVGGGAIRALPLEVFAYVRAGQDQLASAGALLLLIPPMAAFVALRWAARQTVAVAS